MSQLQYAPNENELKQIMREGEWKGNCQPKSQCKIVTNIPKFGRIIPDRIFIGGFDLKTNEQDLKNYFSQFGKVTRSKVVRDRADISKGFGFITFENIEDAIKVKAKDTEFFLNGKKLNVGAAVEKLQTSFPKDVHLPTPTGSWVVHPGGYSSFTHQNGITYFPPSLSSVSTVPPHLPMPNNPSPFFSLPYPSFTTPHHPKQVFSMLPSPQNQQYERIQAYSPSYQQINLCPLPSMVPPNNYAVLPNIQQASNLGHPPNVPQLHQPLFANNERPFHLPYKTITYVSDPKNPLGLSEACMPTPPRTPSHQ